MTTCWFPECPYPATGKGGYPLACWSHIPDSDDRYPVIVTYTHRHVAWVAAPSQEDAVRYIQDEPYEKTNDQETLFDQGWTVQAPADRYDWDDVQDGGYYFPYQGTNANAHVEEHVRHLYEVKRAAEKATCAAAGHPDAKPDHAGAYCPVCWRLPVEAVAS